MNNRGNLVAVPLVLLVIPPNEVQIKNLGKISPGKETTAKENTQFSLNIWGAVWHVDWGIDGYRFNQRRTYSLAWWMALSWEEQKHCSASGSRTSTQPAKSILTIHVVTGGLATSFTLLRWLSWEWMNSFILILNTFLSLSLSLLC